MVAVKTPCIGVCSTGIGDSVCRGCKRFAHEVIQWNAYSDQERSAILQRLDSLLCQVIDSRIRVMDAEMLAQQLRLHCVRVNSERPQSSWVYEALRTFGGQLPNVEVIGCKVENPWAHLSVVQLKESIEKTVYELSCAHYQRYFPGYM